VEGEREEDYFCREEGRRYYFLFLLPVKKAGKNLENHGRNEELGKF
jgi:hypothetical protein